MITVLIIGVVLLTILACSALTANHDANHLLRGLQ